MSSPYSETPVNPLPPAVSVIALIMIVIELAFQLGERNLAGSPAAVGWRLEAIQSYAFSGEYFDWMVGQGVWPAAELLRFVTYPFVHGNFTHALFVVVFLLALGKMVGEVFGTFAFLAVFFSSAIVGALAYAVILNDPVPLIGGFPAVYGLIGGFTFLLWTNLARTGGNQYRAFSLIGMLLGIQLVFGLLFGTGNDWVAEVAGFVSGFLVSFVVSPGGWGQIVAKLRQR